jgi:tRNA 2-selenouridine synthase
MNNIEPQTLSDIFLNSTPLIDVRAPIEFDQGSLPGAINLPILTDAERAQVGTVYQQEGNEAAIKLGHQLVSGSTKKSRIQQWTHSIQENPKTVIYCFRGGQRSQITQKWIREAGIDTPLIEGGYKAGRHFLMKTIADFSESQPVISVCGPTGSGKTHLIESVKSFYPAIDLEGLACHRGSAFGNLGRQPSQIDFENRLAVELLQINERLKSLNPQCLPLFEDESYLIGRCALPNEFFARLQSGSMICVDEPLDSRVNTIFDDYILKSDIGSDDPDKALVVFDRYKKAVQSISRKLGGLRTKEVLGILENAELDFKETSSLTRNREWIEKLLVYYYDPMYLTCIQRRAGTLLFKGTRTECSEYLTYTTNCKSYN